jgi:hypothetical protein
MRVKNVVVEKNLIPILHVYEEQKVRTVGMQCGNLSFAILSIDISFVTMDISHVGIEILKEAMYFSLQN